jgi:hypothetical protein
MKKKILLSKSGGVVSPFLADLVAYYNFDTNSNDFSGNSNNGTDTAISYSNLGKVGNSATFNGTTSKISVPQSTNFDFSNATNDLPFSTSIGVEIVNNTTNYTIFGKNKNTANNGQYNLYILSGKIYILLWQNPVAGFYIGRVTTATLSASTWYQIGITYDGSALSTGIKIYLNGVESTTTNFSSGVYVKMPIVNEPLIIGQLQGSSAFNLNGKLDEFYIWKNRVLTSGEMLTAYNNFNTGQTLI